MKKEEIVETMSESEGHQVRCIEKDGDEWTGIVDVFESEFENEGDEENGASICVSRDDGHNVVVYDNEIESISLM